MEAVRGGRKKKYTPTAASQLKLNPFNYSPGVEVWGAKKKLSSILLQERETFLLPLLKYPIGAHSAGGCLDVQVQVLYHYQRNRRLHNGSKKGIAKSHLCPEGLWTLLSQSHPCCPPHPQQPFLWCDP